MVFYTVLAQLSSTSVVAPFFTWIITQMQAIIRPVGVISVVGLGLWMLVDRHHVVGKAVGMGIALAVAALGPTIANALLSTLGS